MTDQTAFAGDVCGVESSTGPACGTPRAPEAGGVKFARDRDFHAALKRRVDEFFDVTGRRRRDVPRMYLKTAVLLTSFALIYSLLVFVASAWWMVLPLCALLGIVTAAIGFDIQHDGGHQAYSEHPWINRLAAMSLDLIGGSSYLWHYKHCVYHHTFVNITGEDVDIDLGALARFTPHQRRYFYHRLQHLYVWPLYGLMAIKWQLFDDFKDVVRGRMGDHTFPRPRAWDLVVFLGGKLMFISLAFVIPMLFHPFWIVVACYAVTAVVLGMFLSIVFQLAHCVENADFPMPDEATARMENSWAVHQVETTVNFSRRSRVMAWLLGGLNFQIEHHLLPRICHINYPELSKVVEQTCREYEIRYHEHPSFFAGVVSHFRWLRQMGMPATSA